MVIAVILSYMNFGDRRVESLVREEIQGATEDNARVVASLQGCDKHCLAAYSVWVLLHLKKELRRMIKQKLSRSKIYDIVQVDPYGFTGD